MKHLSLATAVVLSLHATVAAAQQLPAAPTRTSAPSTTAQDTAIAAGIDLHDEGKYDEAIARYQAVLKENPTNMTALFELSFSYLAKKDYQKSLDTARTGAEYKSDLLPMFYNVIGESFDRMGDPKQAVAAYRRGIELVPDASILYFNMAVTYRETLKDDAQAREALKKAAAIDPTHAPTELLLGQLFQDGGYHTQALLALATYLMLEPGGGGSLQGYGLWRLVLRGGLDVAARPDPGLTLKPSKTDEGDFSAIDAFLAPSYAAAAKEQDEGKREIDALIGQFDAILTRLSARDPAADRATFAGSYYVPYFVELKKRDYVERFVYWICQRAPIPGVQEWVNINRASIREMLEWSSKYSWAR